MSTLHGALQQMDWRERTFELYRTIRAHGEPQVAHALWREGRDQMFASHPASPLLPQHRDGFAGLTVAPYDERYRFEAALEPAVAHTEELATGGTVLALARVGLVNLALPDAQVSLDVWQLTSYGGGLFLPLRDKGSGSFAGGRFVIDTMSGANLGGSPDNGTLIVDLNFAYNPPCAYDPARPSTQLPPGSTSSVAVPVGEQHAGPWVGSGLR